MFGSYEVYIKPEKYFTFGKYCGSLVSDIWEENPEYIVWLHQNTKYKFDKEVFGDTEVPEEYNDDYESYVKMMQKQSN